MAGNDKKTKKDDDMDLFSGGSISGGSNDKKQKAQKPQKNKNQRTKQQRQQSATMSKVFSKRNVKIIRWVIIVVVIIALLFAYVATGTVRKGFIHSTLQWTTYVTGVTVKSDDGDKYKIPVSTYNYYYAMTYNSLQSTQSEYESYGLDLETYGLDVDFDSKLSKQKTTNDDGQEVTWAEYLEEEVIESIKTTYAYYSEAVKANGGVEPELTDDQKSELNETLAEYKETANGYGYTLSGYLVQAMGKGVTEKVFRREATRAYIAENYEEALEEDEESVEYTDSDFEAYKDENPEEFDRVSIMIYEAESEKDAKNFCKDLNSDGSNFAQLCAEYAEEDFYKTYYEDEGAYTYLDMTRENLKTLGFGVAAADEKDSDSYSGLDWLFSDSRQAGDSNYFGTSVVYVISPAEFSDMKAVNVRHILVVPETDDDVDVTDATDEQWQAAYEEAQSILDEYEETDKTAADFAALAEEHSEDTADGGLYEDITPGQMIDTFNYWCFSGHEAGDTGIIKSQYGYHIMYFEDESESAVWELEAEDALEDAAANEVVDAYTAKVSWFGSRYFEIDTDIDF